MITTQPPLVEVRDLHVAYGGRQVLKGVNLDIPRGKLVAILGTSGSGKTTLLRLLGGQLRPARGSVKVNGQVVHELNTHRLYALRRQMGMMFQAGGLFSDLSVYENIAFPMREHTTLPEDIIRDLVLMKLTRVGLRGAHKLDAGGALRGHGAPRGPGARHRARPDADHVRRAVGRPEIRSR